MYAEATGFFGVLLLYFIPGYCASKALFPGEDIFRRIILSVGPSLLIVTALSTSLGALKILSYEVLAPAIVILSLAIFLWARRIGRTDKSANEVKCGNPSLANALFLIFVVFLVFGLVAKARLSYDGFYKLRDGSQDLFLEGESVRFDLPIHADEWCHLAQALHVMREKSLVYTNPYIAYENSRLNPEIGFHMFLASHFILTKSDPVFGYKYLAPLFAALAAVYLYVFVERITDRSTAILSTVLFGSLRSNVNMMGLWFFTPLTMSFFAIFLILYLHLQKNRMVYPLIIPLFLIYPPAGFLVLAALLIEKIQSLQVKQRLFGNAAFILVVAALYLQGSIPLSVREPNAGGTIPLTFPIGEAWRIAPDMDYNIVHFFGFLKTLMGVFGLYLMLRTNVNRILLYLVFAAGLDVFLGRFAGQSLLIPYIRAVYYLLLFLTPLSAMGVIWLCKTLASRFPNRVFRGIICAILVLSVLASSFHSYYDIVNQGPIATVNPKSLVLIYLVDSLGYDAINYTARNYPPGQVILADSMMSYGIYPISRNHAVSMKNANLGIDGGEKYKRFVGMECDYKDLAWADGISLMILKKDMNCSWMRKVYENEVYKVYNVSV